MADLFDSSADNVGVHLKNIYTDGELEESATTEDFIDLLARERGEGLHGILGSIEQTMFGEALYPSREKKAAHLFYFVIKDHPFADGNKRSAAFLLLLYLRQEAMPTSINPAALTALTLLVAESQPQNKDLMIRLIVNLLAAEAGEPPSR